MTIYNNSIMKKEIKSLVAAKIGGFRLPRYRELPDVGLYLEQVTKYINGAVSDLGCMQITSAMISNYVKQGVVAPPVKKQYYREQIAYLIFIGIAKHVLQIENIKKILAFQKAAYTPDMAYDYFCSEFENMLFHTCGIKDNPENIGVTDTGTKDIFKSVIVSACHIIYISNCFDVMKEENECREDEE